MITNATSSSAEVVLQFKSKQYDFLLSDTTDSGQAIAANLITQLDWSKIPNVKNISPQFRAAYPWGLPTDYGKVGIAYRPDLVGGATITSWQDFWDLIPKYSGQTIFIDLERDCMGSTCKYLGYSSNTTDPDEMKKVQDAIVNVKPHLKAFLNTNVGAGLVNGSTAMAMDWDYDVALLQQQNDKIKWVLPEEGVHAYLEGFTAVQDTSKIDVIQAFLNFLAEPAQYADFVNTTGTAYMIPAVDTADQEDDLAEPGSGSDQRGAGQDRVRQVSGRRRNDPLVEHVDSNQGGVTIEHLAAPPPRAPRGRRFDSRRAGPPRAAPADAASSRRCASSCRSA